LKKQKASLEVSLLKGYKVTAMKNIDLNNNKEIQNQNQKDNKQ